MDKLVEILKRHVWCIIILAAILLLSVTVLSFGADVSLVSHFSFASAIVSIVLAIIVIVYMYFQDHRSSQNITEMKSLIDQASRAMTDKAGLMVDKAQSMEQIMKEGMIQPLSSDSEPTTPPLEINETLRFNFSAYGYMGILVLYSLVKSYESKKTMSWHDISKLFEKTGLIVSAIQYYGFGVIQSFKTFLGQNDSVLFTEHQEVKKIPEGFEESVRAEINERLDRCKAEGNDKGYDDLKGAQKIIDNYFDNL